ncbi:Actin-binding protein IPP [Holothuria leucospilota]|uniref:Actin-binding protein IPP n=1 Tax=Holothuria leucospilota TaxID=206669 RepID=A0A9Q1HC30_HOLLE|nr:Actin-binding protein IPP [Holothuria leucospilota]
MGLHKLLRQDYFTDVTIKAGKREIKAHRLILSAASPYFEAMFMSGLREKDQEVVEIHSVKETHLHLLVEFIYSGEFNLILIIVITEFFYSSAAFCDVISPTRENDQNLILC